MKRNWFSKHCKLLFVVLAVLVLLSQTDYFTDPHSTSLFIQNVILKNKCIDKTNIIGYGFSQGAKFVVELACVQPELFRAVISGSGFYQITFKELIFVLPVSFYFALSENDKGIFEQGEKQEGFAENGVAIPDMFSTKKGGIFGLNFMTKREIKTKPCKTG